MERLNFIALFGKFQEISIALNGTDNNVVVSPASIQPLLLLLADGLSKGELRNLLRAMHLSTHPGAVYREFQKYRAFASIKTSSVEVLSNQTVFADPHRPQDIGYIDSLQRNYKVHLESIDFGDPNAAAKTINSYVATQTRGKIATVVQPQFLINARLALTSTIYFNGKWKVTTNRNRHFSKKKPLTSDKADKHLFQLLLQLFVCVCVCTLLTYFQ